MTPYYERDGIVIYHGDMLEVLPTLTFARGSVRAVLTDPPYNAGKNYGKGTNDRREWKDWSKWLDDVLRTSKASAPDVFMTLSQPAYRAYVKHGRHVIDWSAIWHKPFSNSICAAPFMPHWEHIAYWGARRKSNRKGTNEIGWGSDVFVANVEIGHGRSHGSGHPTPKPIVLMRKIVAQLDHEVFIDPFMGSGTTLRAAMEIGRQAVGIEVEERWCEAAATWLDKHPVLMPLRLPARYNQETLDLAPEAVS